MKHIREKVEGPFAVVTDTALHGMITVQALVRSGVTFVVHGMVTGDLVVEDGAQAIVHSSVNGTIHNHGQVVSGTADALVDLGPRAQSTIDKAAVIKGQRV